MGTLGAAETRVDRARRIAATKGAIKHVKAQVYAVKSQEGICVYRVTLDDERPSCTCPDAVSRGPADFRAKPCKHFLGVRFYLTPEGATPKDEQAKRLRVTYKQDWSAYNAAQTREIALFDELLKDLVSVIEEPEQTIGRPRVPLQTSLFCSIQKVYSQLSLRRAHGIFQNAVDKAHLENAPHFNVPSKLLNRSDLTPILHDLIRESARPLASIEETWAIDSTGFRTTSFNSYYPEKHGAKKQNIWLKAHLQVGTSTHVINSVVVTDATGPRTGDTSNFAPLLKGAVDNGFRVKEILADKAYSSRENLNLAGDLGAEALIPFKQGSRPRRGQGARWAKALAYFTFYSEEFNKRYHQRSNAESAIGAIKRKFGETLKSKNRVAQENELLCKIIAYNITVLIHEMHENGIEPSFVGLAPPSKSPPAAAGPG